MTARYPLETLLRPPVELWSAATAVSAACGALLAPTAFMMTPDVAHGAAGALALLAAQRVRQARRVLRYQRNLRRVPRYVMRAARVPHSNKRLFLGRGFRWTALHAQRLLDARRPMARRYVEPGLGYSWLRRKEVAWERTPVLRHVAALLAWRSPWNPLSAVADVGGLAQLHGVEPQEQDVWMSLGARVGHTLVLGTTQVGKTRLAELLITQDIRRRDVVIVFDPKGDAGLLRRIYAEAARAGRLDELYIFHLGFPAFSARYNPVGSFARITEVASRVTEPLPDQGNSAAFKEFAWRFSNSIAKALVALGRKPNLELLLRFVSNIEPLFVQYTEHWLGKHGPSDWKTQVQKIEGGVACDRDLRQTYKGRGYHAIALAQYLQGNDLYDPVADSLRGAFTYDRTFFDKLVASLLPLLEKLTSGAAGELLVPDYRAGDPRPVIDWMQVIRRRGIVYVGLDALSDRVVATAVGNAMFADLTSVAGRLYNFGRNYGLPAVADTGEEPAISVHADEFNEIVGDEFIPMLNKAAGAGFQVTAYTQTAADIEARFGSAAKAGQAIGNFNTLIMLRVKDPATVELLTNQLHAVEVASLVEDSGATDASQIGSGIDFTSHNKDRIDVREVPMLTPADVTRLPKGQAFALLEGGTLWKIRMPLPDPRRDPGLPPTLQAMAQEMARRYATGDEWWQASPGDGA